jgi:hypothetical protein
MPRLKNVTINSISLQMFNIATPTVLGIDQESMLFLKPGEDVDETKWLVEDNTSTSYNANLIDYYIKKNILTRIP